MSAIDQVFERLRTQGRKAFIPFVTAGDPDLEMTAAALRRLDSLGCSIGEVGIPYSDPIADGPTIQASYQRALDRKTRLDDVFTAVGGVAPELQMPLVTMVSYAIIHRRGLDCYIAAAQAAGFAGAIVPDLPVEESDRLCDACRSADFSLIPLVTPTTKDERAIRIAEKSSGFIYYVSVTGITGERTQLPENLLQRIEWLRNRTERPICIGFGISRPEHVKLLAPAADGVIVGSAIVRQLGLTPDDREATLDAIESVVGPMLAALPQQTS